MRCRLDVNFGDRVTAAPRMIELPPCDRIYRADGPHVGVDGTERPTDFGEVVHGVTTFADLARTPRPATRAGTRLIADH